MSNRFTDHHNIDDATDVWLTPPWIPQSLGEFDLDPCAQKGFELAKENYYDFGLLREWKGRVWLNPPYSDITPWMQAMAVHRSGIALVFARTDTAWWHNWVAPYVPGVFFFQGRLRFLSRDGVEATANAGAPSCLIAYSQADLAAIVSAQDYGVLKGSVMWSEAA